MIQKLILLNVNDDDKDDDKVDDKEVFRSRSESYRKEIGASDEMITDEELLASFQINGTATHEQLPAEIAADLEIALNAALYSEPVTKEQFSLNTYELKILANKASLMTFARKLYLSLHKLFSETVPKEDTKVMHTHYNSVFIKK